MDNNEKVQTQRIAKDRLVERLRQGIKGNTITDEELTTICGRNTSPSIITEVVENGQTKKYTRPGDGYQILLAAIKQCEEEHKVVWERILNRQYKGGTHTIECLGPKEINTSVHKQRRAIHRKSKRQVTKLYAAIADPGITNQEKSTSLVLAAQLGTIASLSHGKATKIIESKVATPAKLDLRNLLEQFDKTRKYRKDK